MKTNLGLVKFTQRALNERWGYVWGTYGQVLTPSLLQSKIKQYPSQVGTYQTFIKNNWLNRITVDCIGLIKAYMWLNESTNKVTYDSSTDVNTGMMYNKATKKGSIANIPEIPGIAVYKQGHIGVYIGDRQVIEAHNTGKGVIKTPLKGTGATAWTHWLRIPYIEYVEGDKMSNKPSSWAKEAWEWAVKEKLMDGTKPLGNITREQIAVILHRLSQQGKLK